MTHPTRWTTEDFESMSWHDASVHGFQFVGYVPDRGACDVVFDIDYILEWTRDGDGFAFVVVQASLRFHDVFGLRFSVDYATPTAGMCSFMLDGIERSQRVNRHGRVVIEWRIGINWPQGDIGFEASGFTQERIGEPVRSRRQDLDASQRVRPIFAEGSGGGAN